MIKLVQSGSEQQLPVTLQHKFTKKRQENMKCDTKHNQKHGSRRKQLTAAVNVQTHTHTHTGKVKAALLFFNYLIFNYLIFVLNAVVLKGSPL